MTNRKKAFDKLSTLGLEGMDSTLILEEILGNYLTGEQALEAVEHCFDAFGLSEEEETEY
jgi:hypothetical protein